MFARITFSSSSSYSPLIKGVFKRNASVLRRAYMYVPGDDEKKINKALGLDVDSVVLDCEDGVALNKKAKARETIRNYLDKGKAKNKMGRNYDLGVRCNSVESGLLQEDLKTILGTKNLPDTISIPKVENTEHVKWIAEEINKNSASSSTSKNKLDLIIFIESAIAMINLAKILNTCIELQSKSNYNLSGLVFGSDDFCASIGATRTENSTEILYARQKLILYAKAFNLQAIDMVYIQYKDLEGLRKQCEDGKRMGFTGKQVIHPGQVPIVQEAFLPNKKEIDWAKGLLKAFEEHQKIGKGAFSYKGSMIDMPTMKQAQNIIEIMKNMHTQKQD